MYSTNGFRSLQGICVALSCLLMASAVQGHPCDRDPGHKHCDGGGGDPPSGDRPLVIKVECDAGFVCPIASDGQGYYEHGIEGVQAELLANGYVLFNGSSAGKSTTPTRGLNWNHTHDPIVLASSGTYTTLAGGTTSPVGSSATYNYHSQIQINRRGDLDFEAMPVWAVGEPEVDYEHDVDLWAQAVIHDPKHPSIIAHRYDGKTGDPDFPNAQNECVDTGQFPTEDAKILRTAVNQWKVTASLGTSSCALIQDANAPKADRLRETAFDMAPFRIIIELID